MWFGRPGCGLPGGNQFRGVAPDHGRGCGARYRDEIDAVNRNLERLVSERTVEVQRQRDELEQKNQDIEDSLRYAQTMQQAVLPDIRNLHATFAEAFALWKPRDIVSGDFYWFHQTERACLVAVADCTGHGVPGAFMSFIGNDLLTQIVVERKIDDPARILAELDTGVQRVLKQGSHGSVSVEDGMDIGICRFTADGVTFAGARRPLYAVADGQLTEYAGSRHPIGGRARKPRHFENVAVAITSPMMLYLTTDGFADQPDAQGKRFKTGPLMQLLRDIATRPAGQQRAALETALDEHQGHTAQRDDITIVGLRLDASLVRWNGSTTHATP
jgi:serine phosphatase RsbU (regulator of sigma subunit)